MLRVYVIITAYVIRAPCMIRSWYTTYSNLFISRTFSLTRESIELLSLFTLAGCSFGWFRLRESAPHSHTAFVIYDIITFFCLLSFGEKFVR